MPNNPDAAQAIMPLAIEPAQAGYPVEFALLPSGGQPFAAYFDANR